MGRGELISLKTGIAVAALALSAGLLAQEAAEPVHPPPHTSPWPTLGTGATPGMVQASYAQIAETLGISPKTVGIHIGRAIQRLRQVLAQVR